MTENTFVIIIVIGVTAVLIFVAPMIMIADKIDTTTQMFLQTKVDEFVIESSKVAVITQDSLDNFKAQINSTGNVYDIQLEIKVLDDASIKDKDQGQTIQIEGNNYYVIYTTTIEDIIYNSAEKQYTMKPGDILTVEIKNVSPTAFEGLINFFAKITGNEASTLYASSTSMITVNGK